MPRLVDYPARFAFLRRAAFVVVRDHGPHALSRRAVAEVLGISVNSVVRLVADDADLRLLALDEVERRRRQALWRRPRGLEGPDLAVALLRSLVADDEDRIAEELVWHRVAVEARRVAAQPGESVAGLRAEHAVAVRGYPDDPARAARQEAASRAAPAPAPGSAITERLAEHEQDRERAVAAALAAIGVHEEDERHRSLAVVDGVALAACLGRTSPEEAVAVVEHHVTSLARAATATRPAPR